MGNVGGGELLVILLVALIVLGPARLPTAIREVGRVVGQVRRMGAGFQQELRDAVQPIRDTKATIKAADPLKVIAPPSEAVSGSHAAEAEVPQAPGDRGARADGAS